MRIMDVITLAMKRPGLSGLILVGVVAVLHSVVALLLWLWRLR